MRFGVPKGMSVLSWDGREFKPDRYGNIEIPISDTQTLNRIEASCHLVRGGHPVETKAVKLETKPPENPWSEWKKLHWPKERIAQATEVKTDPNLQGKTSAVKTPEEKPPEAKPPEKSKKRGGGGKALDKKFTEQHEDDN